MNHHFNSVKYHRYWFLAYLNAELYLQKNKIVDSAMCPSSWLIVIEINVRTMASGIIVLRIQVSNLLDAR